MSPSPRIEDLVVPPQVGALYDVPGIIQAGGWRPTLGPPHADPELVHYGGAGAAREHLHYDARFLPSRAIPSVMRNGASYIPLLIEYFEPVGGQRPVRERRVVPCMREQPAYPAVSVGWLPMLESRYATARACGRCPHRGFPLAGLPIEADGGITCPGHGLRWHAETGALMPRGHTLGHDSGLAHAVLRLALLLGPLV